MRCSNQHQHNHDFARALDNQELAFCEDDGAFGDGARKEVTILWQGPNTGTDKQFTHASTNDIDNGTDRHIKSTHTSTNAGTNAGTNRHTKSTIHASTYGVLNANHNFHTVKRPGADMRVQSWWDVVQWTEC
jgi:hypothetical protein